MTASEAAVDPQAFIDEQVELLLAVGEAVRDEPLKFARLTAEEAYDKDLYERHKVQWVGTMACEVMVIVVGVLFTAGALTAAKFGAKTATIVAKIRRAVPARLRDRITDRDKRDAPGCTSFPAGTPVVMADGTTTAIDRVAPGDWVLTYDVTSGSWGANEVLTQWSGVHTDPMVTVTLTNGTQVVASSSSVNGSASMARSA